MYGGYRRSAEENCLWDYLEDYVLAHERLPQGKRHVPELGMVDFGKLGLDPAS
jgi:hypothetical protein